MSLPSLICEISKADGFDVRPGSARGQHGPRVEHFQSLVLVPLIPGLLAGIPLVELESERFAERLPIGRLNCMDRLSHYLLE